MRKENNVNSALLDDLPQNRSMVSGGGCWIKDAVFFTCFATKNIKEFPYFNRNYS